MGGGIRQPTPPFFSPESPRPSRKGKTPSFFGGLQGQRDLTVFLLPLLRGRLSFFLDSPEFLTDQLFFPFFFSPLRIKERNCIPFSSPPLPNGKVGGRVSRTFSRRRGKMVDGSPSFFARLHTFSRMGIGRVVFILLLSCSVFSTPPLWSPLRAED